MASPTNRPDPFLEVNEADREYAEEIHDSALIRQRFEDVPDIDDNISIIPPQSIASLKQTQGFEARALQRNGWWNLWGISEYGSELLENNGSVARDHMASERTFLSWIRTSLALVSAGVGVTQLFKLARETDKNVSIAKFGDAIGSIFILIGILCVVMGVFRFFRTQELMKHDRFAPARGSISLLVFLVFATCIFTLVVSTSTMVQSDQT